MNWSWNGEREREHKIRAGRAPTSSALCRTGTSGHDNPDTTPDVAAPLIAAATLGVVTPLALCAPRAWQLWAPLIGVVVGCMASSFFGLYDYQSVLDAAWVGLPDMEWPGLYLGFGAEFWALLVTFALISLVSALETEGDGVAVQQVSRRRPRTTDFRVIQGALNADGLGNVLSGLAGTAPNTTYSSSIPLIALTGVAARRVGVCTPAYS